MTPQEQEKFDKDVSYVSKTEVDERIASADFRTRDYDNITICTITCTNGFRVAAEVVAKSTDISRTDAYNRAHAMLRTCMMYQRAEHYAWMKEQERELGMLHAFGHQGGE